MNFHLFGVTVDKARLIHAKRGHTWVSCDKHGCDLLVDAVFLYRDGDGDIVGVCACTEHEDEMLTIMQSSAAYGGVQAVEMPTNNGATARILRAASNTDGMDN